MKRLLMLAIAGLFSLGLMAQSTSTAAQSDNNAAKTDKKVAKAENKEAKTAAKGKDMSLTGWVKEEGGKTTFVNDKDKQSWEISNPDAVKGHEGHHVKVKAKLDEANHSLTVDSLKMMKESKQSGEQQKSDKKS
ncbi:MAG TPA: hypothetical protein VHN74_03400 [Candidatus Angelobacter sp.]|jgi:hypothetical protein|nr:hypothetical protein [Candidatus Angelobacter sp.]